MTHRFHQHFNKQSGKHYTVPDGKQEVTIETPFIREVQGGDIEFLAENLREADRNELTAAGNDSVLETLREAVSISKASHVAVVHGKPFAIRGVVQSGSLRQGNREELHGIPWMLGTPEVEKYPVFIHKAGKSWVQELLGTYDVLYNQVHSGNKLHITWIKRLGFIVLAPFVAERTGELFHPFTLRSNYV